MHSPYLSELPLSQGSLSSIVDDESRKSVNAVVSSEVPPAFITSLSNDQVMNRFQDSVTLGLIKEPECFPTTETIFEKDTVNDLCRTSSKNGIIQDPLNRKEIKVAERKSARLFMDMYLVTMHRFQLVSQPASIIQALLTIFPWVFSLGQVDF